MQPAVAGQHVGAVNGRVAVPVGQTAAGFLDDWQDRRHVPGMNAVLDHHFARSPGPPARSRKNRRSRAAAGSAPPGRETFRAGRPSRTRKCSSRTSSLRSAWRPRKRECDGHCERPRRRARHDKCAPLPAAPRRRQSARPGIPGQPASPRWECRGRSCGCRPPGPRSSENRTCRAGRRTPRRGSHRWETCRAMSTAGTPPLARSAMVTGLWSAFHSTWRAKSLMAMSGKWPRAIWPACWAASTANSYRVFQSGFMQSMIGRGAAIV